MSPTEEKSALGDPKAKALSRGGSEAREWVVVIGKLLLPVVVLVLGVLLKGSVEHALKRRALEVESAQAIEILLTTLHKSGVSAPEAAAASLTLAAYGEAAIVPLIGALEYGSAESETAAKRALFVIGLSHPEEVTRSLASVLSMRQGQFKWRTHRAAIDILGEISHRNALKTLKSYRNFIKQPKEWMSMVTGAELSDFESTQRSLARALLTFGVKWTPPKTGGNLP